jgi:hypothetical protein
MKKFGIPSAKKIIVSLSVMALLYTATDAKRRVKLPFEDQPDHVNVVNHSDKKGFAVKLTPAPSTGNTLRKIKM